jgi:predicted lipase
MAWSYRIASITTSSNGTALSVRAEYFESTRPATVLAVYTAEIDPNARPAEIVRALTESGQQLRNAQDAAAARADLVGTTHEVDQ